MLLEKFSLTTVIIGTTAFGLLSTITPKVAQAADFKVTLSPGFKSPYTSQFNIRTGVKPENPNTSPVEYERGIGGFSVIKIPPNQAVSNSINRFLDLEIRRIADVPDPIDSTFIRLGFTNIQGPFYEYKFTIPNPQNILISPPPAPFANDGTIRFYVPSVFTYTASDRTFPSSFTNPDQQLLASLGGIRTILGTAGPSGVGLPSIFFPSNVVGVNGQNVGVEIETTPIPESNSLAGLFVLVLIGGRIIVKQKFMIAQDS